MFPYKACFVPEQQSWDEQGTVGRPFYLLLLPQLSWKQGHLGKFIAFHLS